MLRYEQYISSPEWYEKRRQRLEIDKHECRLCGSKEDLEVHHKPDSYQLIPFESVADDLTTLCLGCHDLITDKIRRERYSNKQTITPEQHPLQERKVVDHEKLERIEMQAHRGMPDNFAQRVASGSIE